MGFSKKLYGGTAHPAVFSKTILPVIAGLLDERHRLTLDPFAGVGGVYRLAEITGWDMEIIGVELEKEWAAAHPRTIVGNVLSLPFRDGQFDAVVTSPTYGNRLADHHNARDSSWRRSYTHDLGRNLSSSNSGAMQWGDNYRRFHRNAWGEVRRVLRDGGRLALNISDHIRGGKRQHVAHWHVMCLAKKGFKLADAASVVTPRLRTGANRTARVTSEMVLAFDT